MISRKIILESRDTLVKQPLAYQEISHNTATCKHAKHLCKTKQESRK